MQARNSIVRKLLAALDEKLPGQREHAARVAVYATATGAALGLQESALLALRYAAELHDYGLLFAPDPEAVPWRHALVGAEALTEYEWLGESLLGIRCHHERWNGSGMPVGLAGTDIPLAARILAVANALDDATLNRSPPKTEETALRELYENGGRLFDPAVVKAFLSVQPIIQPVGL